MPYTLVKGTLWFALALLLGFVIGYVLRSVVANRQIRSARAAARPDSGELDRLRGRIANLEPVVAERDRLRAELDVVSARRPVDDASSTDLTAADEDARVGDDAAVAEPQDDAPTPPDEPSELAPVTAQASPPADLDVGRAAEVLGRTVELDDLTVVEGIGPAIADLCHGIGIHTWLDLATTEVSLLRTMLDDAGPRYRVHEPDTWPEQAELLAHGDWQAFVALTDGLDHGKRI